MRYDAQLPPSPGFGRATNTRVLRSRGQTMANMMWDGVSALHVKVMDSDVMFDDPLGHASVW